MQNYPHRPTAPAAPRSVLARGNFLKYAQAAAGRPWVRKIYKKLPYLGPALTAADLAYQGYNMVRYRKRPHRVAFNPSTSTRQIPFLNTKRRKITNGKGNAKAGPITTQSDYKQSKGFKRLTKRQKSWKKFVKKVHKATDQNDKTHFIVEAHDTNLGVTGTAGVQFQQVVATNAAASDINLQLSPVGNTAMGPGRFITNLIQQKAVTTVAAGTTATATTFRDTKYKLLGASCTISMKNDTTSNMYIDIYECVASSHITETTFQTARAAWINCLNLNGQPDQTAGFNKLLTTHSGCTPYQAPGFGKYWKIIKKTRVFTTPASITNYTYFTRPRLINNAAETGRFATKGLTKDLIIVTNPTFNGDTILVNLFDIEWSKSYAVKLDDMPGLQAQWAYQAVD